MSATDPADLVHRRAIAAAARLAPPRACPSCGEVLPARRLFCTEYCRSAVHRIRRTEADLVRLGEQLAAASSEHERRDLVLRIERLQDKRDRRDHRLAQRRQELVGVEDDEAAG